MLNTDPYLDYWQKQNQQQKEQNQYLAEQARESLTPIIKYLTDTFKIKKIILFGSLAKGKFKETSDIDLAVAGIPVTAYFQALAKVNSLSDRWIDLKPLEDLDPYFLELVIQTGECLYDSENSLGTARN